MQCFGHYLGQIDRDENEAREKYMGGGRGIKRLSTIHLVLPTLLADNQVDRTSGLLHPVISVECSQQSQHVTPSTTMVLSLNLARYAFGMDYGDSVAPSSTPVRNP